MRFGPFLILGLLLLLAWMKPLLAWIEKGQIDPSYIISHRIGLDSPPDLYKVWRDKKDQVTKIVIDPWAV